MRREKRRSRERAEDQAFAQDQLVYEMLAHRCNTQNLLVWQTPALAFTAQAFLLTIALGSDSSRFARVLSAALATLLALLSWQLMRKHAVFALRDRLALERMEKVRGMEVVHGKLDLSGERWIARQASQRLWRGGLLLFAAAGLAVLLVALVRPSLL